MRGLFGCLASLWCTLLCVSVPASKPPLLVVKDLRVLVVVYRGETNAPNYLGEREYQSIVNAVECGRLFYFRNTRGRLNLSFTFLPIDTVAPDNRGPTFEHLQADLRRRGIVDNQYDGIFVTGRGLSGNWGGFKVFGESGAAFAIPGMGGQMRQFPSADTNTGFDTAWVFVHEFQHALDLVIAGSAGFGDFLHGHPYTDAEEHPGREVERPGAQHWDWIACTLRNFAWYEQLPGATRSYIFARDEDGDGVPDCHPFLPMDEQRWGSDSRNPDTDGDGLTDLEEFTADIYRGSDPRDPDTDKDGLSDGVDPWPTVAISAHLPYAHPTPVLDGAKDVVYQPLITRWYAATDTNLPPEAVQAYACWDEDTLYVFLCAPQPFSLEMQIDSSPENGFWIGGDTYCFSVRNGAQPMIDEPRLGAWPGATAVWVRTLDGASLCELRLPAQIGRRGVTSGMEFPEDTADGLRLLNAHDVAVNVAIEFANTRERVLLTPPWTMVTTRLRKTPMDPDRPTLRYTPRGQASATPRVRVEGVAATHTVSVVNAAGTVLGSRVGSGWLTLTGVRCGHDAVSGRQEIRAQTSAGITSPPFELVVDTGALPPQIGVVAASNGYVTLALTGEPNAKVVIECAFETNWLPVQTAILDASGTTNVLFDTQLRGFRGEYFASDAFTNPVFWRVDRVLAFDFEDRSPLPGILRSDRFSVRWTGWLALPAVTTATWFLATDDGSRVYVNDALIIDHWGVHSKEEKQAVTVLPAGTHYVKIDYYENAGWAATYLEWQPEGGPRTNALPVGALPQLPSPLAIRARQEDPLGNVSLPGHVLFCTREAGQAANCRPALLF